MQKSIYVCCGTGIATSTVIAKKVGQALKDNGIQHKISQGTVANAPTFVQTNKPDAIVSSADVNGNVGETPVISGRPFLTGIKKNEAIDELLNALK
ncbi:PTS galactitol transporter subunit IIB [Lentibacillus kapialis]|uniref:PTS galactitol transporter subunit IIB n=1 Tax=Lentibacillus kapialis TaxID=340214 RepID=A0A917PYZ6_9BACI|nr:PTS sugar transporter subunit IIB [Lentibacillus kapialis]GGK00668.1 PTS galactitol transporter subunit IIB [Lentibacillus kapialis]